MIKGIVYSIIFSLFALTVGISYSAYFKIKVVVLAEEEERSSEHSKDDIKTKLFPQLFQEENTVNFAWEDAVNEKYKKTTDLRLQTANVATNDIPPEKWM